ncbi:hypothetical protein DSCO28_65910 [Desulfosarcina ovata subsp. sediminis]|uniref:Biopolymer transporter ExbD n=2 Tax=Desulfosarcina ovata TaxID=83564 RepID=A0A5K8A0F3_9BACT|nr:hypothetical protein DSCO28_65910 [Desulfosarcina ovata subsp. sediminis]
MRRRGRQGINVFTGTQDPGKDLFAYLFLIIMVFSMMVLMSVDEGRQGMRGQITPRKAGRSSRSTIAFVSPDRIGRLTMEDGSIWLRFGADWYKPEADAELLERNGRISVVTNGGGGQKRVLYLEEDRTNKVLLADYLMAFQALSRQGINVAFVERVK